MAFDFVTESPGDAASAAVWRSEVLEFISDTKDTSAYDCLADGASSRSNDPIFLISNKYPGPFIDPCSGEEIRKVYHRDDKRLSLRAFRLESLEFLAIFG
jgi:hypothetical protein